MDRDVLMLAELPPVKWKEALRRLEVLKAYEAIPNPTSEDAEAHATKLGISVRRFYGLVKASRMLNERGHARPFRQGQHAHIPAEVNRIIEETRRELGSEVPHRAVELEVARRCRVLGFDPPRAATVRRRIVGAGADLRIRLARRFDLVLDISPMGLDVTDRSGQAAVAMLTGLLSWEAGEVLATRVSAGWPSIDDVLSLLHEGVARSNTEPTLVATGTLADTLTTVEQTLAAMGLKFDLGASHGLRPGLALTTVFGLRIGKVPLMPKRSSAPSLEKAVPLDLARKVIARLVAVRISGVASEDSSG